MKTLYCTTVSKHESAVLLIVEHCMLDFTLIVGQDGAVLVIVAGGITLRGAGCPVGVTSGQVLTTVDPHPPAQMPRTIISKFYDIF